MIAKSLDSAVKAFKPQIKGSIGKPIIENIIFRLHTKFTALLLFAFFFLVCTREYFGDHIKCLKGDGKLEEKMVNNYCFFMTTYTIVTNDNRHLQEGNIPHPGMGPVQEKDRIVKHKYYQWVPFVLFFQCVCFYIPHLIWKKEEGGRMKALVSCLHYARLAHMNENEVKVLDKAVPSKSALRKTVEVIGKDVMLRLQVTRSWSICLITMEVLNLLHLIIQIWITNSFLGGNFLTLGSDWWNYDYRDQNATDPLEILFPMMTKCIFNKFGPSGTIIHHDIMCVMSLNVLYEKIYTILWFWFLILMMLSLLAVIWRIASYNLYRRTPRMTQLLYRRVTPGRLHVDVIAYVIKRCHYADWLFLYYLAKNMPGFLFEELFNRLYDELKQQEGDSKSSADDGNGPLLDLDDDK
ncbi:innexin inx7-like [Plodia interpunctella]|uniref:innexin inx7-like n=1 Tax=Plodia interpunctella TaxID=58824 RepID=UPI0023677A14|nr:innexin inx7-like [Plodia interpunctella]